MLRRLGVGYGGQINVWSRIKIQFGFMTVFLYKLDMFNNAENKPISKISSFTSVPPTKPSHFQLCAFTSKSCHNLFFDLELP